MKKYVTPEMEITQFETKDIIVTSGIDAGIDNNGDGGDGDI
jgi:hypothetical protein